GVAEIAKLRGLGAGRLSAAFVRHESIAPQRADGKDRTADAAGGRLRPPALRLRLSGPSPAALRTECWRPEPALGRGYTDRSGQQALRAHDVHPVSGPDHPRGVWRLLVLGTADSPPRIWTRSCIPAKRWPPREIGVGLAKLRHRNETLL